MIYDSLKNLSRYNLLDQISKFDLSNYTKGKIEIDNDRFFGIGLEYITKNGNECLWEAHQKYLDVHLIIEGEEKIHISDINNMSISQKYDESNDYSLFSGQKENEIILSKGYFLVLYPNEVHKTGIFSIENEQKQIKKIVFKILI